MDPKDIILVDLNDINMSSDYTFNVSEGTITIDTSSTTDFITVDTNDLNLELSWLENWKHEEEWREIHRAAKTNEALQKAIERVKILYYLSKDDGNSKT